MREEIGAPKDDEAAKEPSAILDNVPRALHRFYRKGAEKK